MSILTDFEDRIGGALEGMFAGVFRSPVQPVEIARALAKAMDDGRTLGVGKIYAPLAYTVALSPDDDDNFGTFTATLAGELATYLTDHARERGYHLAGSPAISFTVHDDLKLGRFRVSAELAAPEAAEPEPVVSPTPPRAPARAHEAMPATPADTRPVQPVALPLSPGVFDFEAEQPTVPVPSIATVTVGEPGHDVALHGDFVVVGRLADAGIRIADSNVSREHAAFVREGGGWVLEDLGSTNGTLLNGRQVRREPLADGDIVEIGLTRLVFHAGR